MALRSVSFAAARVVLHRSACSRGYKLSREGADPRSLLRGWCMCCFDSIVLHVAPVSPFIASKERARITFVVKG
jgi:hypothetical protein